MSVASIGGPLLTSAANAPPTATSISGEGALGDTTSATGVGTAAAAEMVPAVTSLTISVVRLVAPAPRDNSVASTFAAPWSGICVALAAANWRKMLIASPVETVGDAPLA